MKRSFSELIAGFPDKYRSLMAQEPVRFEGLPKKGPVGGGIYVFSDGDRILYVGRTKQSIRSRLRAHYKEIRRSLCYRSVVE